jgi:hypothetical protein
VSPRKTSSDSRRPFELRSIRSFSMQLSPEVLKVERIFLSIHPTH